MKISSSRLAPRLALSAVAVGLAATLAIAGGDPVVVGNGGGVTIGGGVEIGRPQPAAAELPEIDLASSVKRSAVREAPLKLLAIEASPDRGGLIVKGEGFGRAAGVVYLRHGPNKVLLKVLDWRPSAVRIASPAGDASCPSSYLLFVALPDGRLAGPLSVQF